MKTLLIVDRPSRQGFPPGVALELSALFGLLDELPTPLSRPGTWTDER
jgi:hypothetical protein